MLPKTKILMISSFLVLSLSASNKPAQAFTCPVPEPETQTPTCIQLAGQAEPQEVKDYLEGGSYLIYRSIEITSGLYLTLMGTGIFRRYVRGRV